MSTDREAIARRWSTDGGMGNTRSADDYTDAGCRLLAEHAFRDVAALLALHPEPRVWRKGDAEPGEDVRAVLDSTGDVRQRQQWTPGWSSTFGPDSVSYWDELLEFAPLVEVTLPPAVSA